MPNTLVHLGIQAAATRSVDRVIDGKWLLIAVVIPDVGWIVQRLLEPTPIPPVELRAYAIVQTSLLCSIWLAAGLSLLSRHAWRVFGVLSANAVIHLLLDASEIKWGNGVLLSAPFDWQISNWGWLWPEQWPVHLLTFAGGLYLAWIFRRSLLTPLDIHWPGAARAWASLTFLSAFAFMPLVLRGHVLETDSHYLRTLTDVDTRAGSYVEIDRAEYSVSPDGSRMLNSSLSNEDLFVSGVDIDHGTVLSIRGHFAGARTIEVSEYHDHGGRGRDVPSIIALVCLAVMLVTSSLRGKPVHASGGR